MTNPADTFFGDTSKSAKFETVGETVGGPIVAIGEPRQQTEFRTDGQPGAPLVWPDGSPRMQLPVTVQTEQRDPSDAFDDGRRTFYIKGEMKKAVAAALKTAGAKMAVGGVLTITFSGEEPTKGFPKKLYTATYVAPTAGAAFFEQPAAQAPVQQPAQPAPQAPASPQMVQLTPEQYAAMQAAMAQQQPAPQAPAAPQKASYEQYAQAMGFTPQNSNPPF